LAKQIFKLKFLNKELNLSKRTHIMGIINITPDSFSNGGLFINQQAAVKQGIKLWNEGADILDIGGESTRPGSEPISIKKELDRIIPVITELATRTQAIISIDTSKAAVASSAINAGATIINDVSALRADPEMINIVAKRGTAIILMHMFKTPKNMQIAPFYNDVVTEVKNFLNERINTALAAGIASNHIIIDPGIGFGKTIIHNLELIRHISLLNKLGYPVLLGASRKTFIGTLTNRKKPKERLWGTIGAHIAGALMGAQIVRVHEITQLKEALLVSDAIARA